MSGGTPSPQQLIPGRFKTTALAVLARTANTNSADLTARGRRAHIIIDIVGDGGGAETLTATVKGKDPVSGNYYTILASTALAADAASTTLLTIAPGGPVTANLSEDEELPETYRVEVVHSGSTAVTYSVGVNEVA